jgi:hypothetical protein
MKDGIKRLVNNLKTNTTPLGPSGSIVQAVNHPLYGLRKMDK